jgi:hypothetical protein
MVCISTPDFSGALPSVPELNDQFLRDIKPRLTESQPLLFDFEGRLSVSVADNDYKILTFFGSQ